MTSLERFVRARGPLFAGGNYGKQSLNFQFGIGVVLTTCGLGGLMLPLFGVDWKESLAALGPLIGGVTNLIVSSIYKRRLTDSRPLTVHLSDEAKKVIVQLNQKYLGSRSGWYWEEGSYTDPRKVRRHQWWPVSTPLLTDSVMARLERAAYQYNRVTALVMASTDHLAITRMANKAGAACDEAMAEVLHQAAWIGMYPEGSDTAVTKLEHSISAMKELGDRIQALAKSEPTFTEKLAARSEMQEALDELRLELVSRSELQIGASDAPNSRLDQG